MRCLYIRLIHTALAMAVSLTVPEIVHAQKNISLVEAIRQTLALNQDVQIEHERVNQDRGLYRSAAGRFNWTLSGTVERTNTSTPSDLLEGNTTLADDQEFYSVGLAKELRNGIRIVPSLSVVELEDPRMTVNSVNVAAANLTLIVPLIRNLGADHTGAEERAAYANVQGARSLRLQNISEHIFNTALAFYDCLAMKEQMTILRDNEALTEESMDTVDRMIRAALLDPADRLQAQAVLSGKRASRRAGEQALFRSRINLAAAIGYPSDRLPDAPLATGAFPDPPDTSRLNALAASDYIQQSLAQRGDYQASLQRIETAQTLLRKAQNARKTRLDLSISMGYASFDLGTDFSRRLKSLYSNPAGPLVTVGLSMGLPLKNDTALGDLAFRASVLRESQYQSERLSMLISAEILTAYEDLRSAVDQYRFVLGAEQIFLETLEHENKKLTAGESSLTDILQIQDRYTSVRLEKIKAQHEYAVALVRFRLVTGSLLSQNNDEIQFDADRLVSLPFID